MSSQKHAAEGPLSLSPENPHYFLFRGKPTVLVTSAEHYGAILNREFDTDKYLAELHKHGLNLTRSFSGVYCEDAAAFGITRNTLAPAEGKLLHDLFSTPAATPLLGVGLRVAPRRDRPDTCGTPGVGIGGYIGCGSGLMATSLQ